MGEKHTYMIVRLLSILKQYVVDDDDDDDIY
jgi:hypothetical protein